MFYSGKMAFRILPSFSVHGSRPCGGAVSSGPGGSFWVLCFFLWALLTYWRSWHRHADSPFARLLCRLFKCDLLLLCCPVARVDRFAFSPCVELPLVFSCFSVLCCGSGIFVWSLLCSQGLLLHWIALCSIFSSPATTFGLLFVVVLILC